MSRRNFPLPLLMLGLFLLTACANPQTWMNENSTLAEMKASATAVLPTAASSPSPSPQPTATTPAATPTAAPPICQEASGIVRHTEIVAIGYSEPLAMSIYQPPCFEENEPEEGYPVLILLHGQTYTDQQWLDIGLPETMDRLIAAEEIPPFVVVMPFESPAYYNTFNYAITRNLLPWLAENQGVCDQFECRAIGGISRGGGWALYSVFQEPGIFSALGMHSTPAFDDTPYYIRRAIGTMSADQFPRIYIDIGAKDYWYSYAWNVKVFFDENGIAHEWHENEGTHENAYWETHLAEYLRWYGAGWTQ